MYELNLIGDMFIGRKVSIIKDFSGDDVACCISYFSSVFIINPRWGTSQKQRLLPTFVCPHLDATSSAVVLLT